MTDRTRRPGTGGLHHVIVPQPTTYEIVLRGRPSDRLLRPFLDDFTIDTATAYSGAGGGGWRTSVVGEIGDSAHLHGIVAHLSSVNVEIISIGPAPTPPVAPTTEGSKMTIQQETTTRRPDVATDEQMYAITQDRYGSADRLSLEVVERPTPQAGEVLIEVVAAAVDRGTCHLLTGTPYLIRIAGFGLMKPKNKIPGFDVAGRVLAVGADVTRFVPGDEVFGLANGSLAEYATAREDRLALKPVELPFDQAASAAVSGTTALEALTDIGNTQPGQQVLIVGASGGVGSFAVQLAKALGADVTAVASTRNLDFMRSLGADDVIDYTAEDFAATGRHYDLILDIGGRNSISRLRRVLATNGTLIIVGGEDANRVTGGVGRQVRALMLSPFITQRLTTFMSVGHHTFIERLAGHLASGAVTPAVRDRYDLADAAVAIDRLDAGQTTGKSVINVSRDGVDRAD